LKIKCFLNNGLVNCDITEIVDLDSEELPSTSELLESVDNVPDLINNDKYEAKIIDYKQENDSYNGFKKCLLIKTSKGVEIKLSLEAAAALGKVINGFLFQGSKYV
jgi:hypothetical protein